MGLKVFLLQKFFFEFYAWFALGYSISHYYHGPEVLLREESYEWNFNYGRNGVFSNEEVIEVTSHLDIWYCVIVKEFVSSLK